MNASKLGVIVVLMAITVALQGCGKSPDKIEVGTPKEAVLDALGVPEKWMKLSPSEYGNITDRTPVQIVFNTGNWEHLCRQSQPAAEIWLWIYGDHCVDISEGKVIAVRKTSGSQK